MTDVETHNLFIGGEPVPAASGETFDVENPATEEVVAKVAKAAPEDVDRAVGAARDAFEGWAGKDPAERAAILEAVGQALMGSMQDLAMMESITSGGTIRRTSTVDAPGVAFQFQQQGQLIRTYPFLQPLPHSPMPAPAYDYVVREPIGVVAAIAPFNFPLFFAAGKTLAALSVGCPVVLKPSPYTPVTAIMLAEIATEAGLPPGVLNVVAAPGAATGEALVTHPDVAKVNFTGSTVTGKRIMQQAAGSLKDVLLECGGKAPNIILPDADLDLAVDGAVHAMFGHSGQVCVAGTRLLVHEDVHDEVVERVVDRASKLTVGDPTDQVTDVGPLISKEQLETVMSYIELGEKDGAKLALGGGRPSGIEKGYFVEPTIFTNVDNSMRIAQEEIFGPVLSILKYSSVDEAVAIANDSPYGLAGGVWTGDNTQGMEIAGRLRQGTVWINDWLYVHGMAPYGGFKESAVGYEGGQFGMDQFVIPKHVHLSLTPDRAQKYWWGSTLS